MLTRTVYLAVIASRRSYVAQQYQEHDNARPFDWGNQRSFISTLEIQVRQLKSIAFTAPYLGLAGMCLGILGAFRRYVGSKLGLIVMLPLESMRRFSRRLRDYWSLSQQ
jgi:biopolymer transport protein ExbB/TolQ